MTLSAAELQNRVNQICDQLYTSNEKVSVRAVLSLLPDISSTSTAHKYVKAWKEERDAKQQSVMERLGFSETFTKSFMAEMGRFNTEAEKRYRDIAEQAKEQAREAIDDLERVEDMLHRQTALLEQAQRTNKQLEDDNREQKKTFERLERELKERLEKYETVNSELNATNEHLRTEIAKAQLKVENGAVYVSEAKEKLADMSNELRQAVNTNSQQAATLAKFEANAERDQRTIAELQVNATSLKQNVDDYRKLMDEANARAQKSDAAFLAVEKKLADQAVKNERELAAVSEKLATASKELADKNQRIEQQDKIIAKFTEQKHAQTN